MAHPVGEVLIDAACEVFADAEAEMLNIGVGFVVFDDVGRWLGGALRGELVGMIGVEVGHCLYFTAGRVVADVAEPGLRGWEVVGWGCWDSAVCVAAG